MSVLEIHNVSIRYITGDFKDIGLKEYLTRRIQHNYHVSEFWADKNISFSLEKGDMLGIIGTNGAGKSTLLKVISGIMEPTAGRVRREGTIAALLELASGFDGDLTVRENAYLRGAMLGYTRKFMDEKYDQIIEFAELQDFQDRPFKQLSSGMKSRLAFSIASLLQPDILILDEVLAVGDGAFRKKSEEKMREIISGGATTILVSHSLKQIREMCTKVLWLDKGKQVAFGGNVQEICDQYEAFLEGKAEPVINNQQTKEARSEIRMIKGESAQKAPGTGMLQLRMICALALVVSGWVLMYINSPLFIVWAVCALAFCTDCWKKRKELGGQVVGLFSAEARRNLIYSCGFVFLFTFIVYGFLFSNEFFSHDSAQKTFYENGPKLSIFRFYLGLGRFLIPIYESMKGPYSAPWLIGLFFTAWTVFTCFLAIELFRFKGRTTIALVCGLLCANTALILTGATYIYCLDEYAFALLVSVLAAYCFCKVPHGAAVGSLLVVFALGIYQPYFTVTLALCFMFAVQRLVRNENAGKVVRESLKQIGLLLISFGIYYVVWTALCTAFQTAKNRTDESLLGKGISDIITIIINSYRDFFKMFLNTTGLLGQAYAVFNVFLFILFLGILFRFLQKKGVSLCNKCLVVILVLCAPLVFSASKIILAGKTSELTGYDYELAYIFSLMWLAQDDDVEKTGAEKSHAGTTRFIAAVLIICVIYNNALLANQAYMKKMLEKSATISLVTRIIDRVETLDGYSPNDTQVYLVGALEKSDLNKGQRDVPSLERRTGLWYNYSATYNLVSYITDYMNYPMRVAVKQDLANISEVQDMPAFPAAGSVKMIDGAVVIKLS